MRSKFIPLLVIVYILCKSALLVAGQEVKDVGREGLLTATEIRNLIEAGSSMQMMGVGGVRSRTVRIRFHNILFDFDSDKLRARSKLQLDEIGRVVSKIKTARLIIEGHTDDIGTLEYNVELSMRRANAVKSYLVKKFEIRDQMITTRGYGPTRPICRDKSSKCRQMNRRVEITFCVRGELNGY